MPHNLPPANTPEEISSIARLRRPSLIRNTLFVSQLHVQTIASFDAPELEPYRTMRRLGGTRRAGHFCGRGRQGGSTPARKSFSRRFRRAAGKPAGRIPSPAGARPEQINVYLAERKFLVTLVGIELFQGVLAVGKIPRTFSLADLLAQSPSPKLFALVEGVTNSENIGLLVRNCAAFGAHGLIISPTCCSPFLRRAVRNSMGAIFQLPSWKLPTSLVPCKNLRAAGVRSIAAHPHTEKRICPGRISRATAASFLAARAKDLSEVLAACDEAVAIPMAANIDSLNVGARPLAVFLYEASLAPKISARKLFERIWRLWFGVKQCSPQNPPPCGTAAASPIPPAPAPPIPPRTAANLSPAHPAKPGFFCQNPRR